MTSKPSMDEWLKEANNDSSAPNIGMYLFHLGTVRNTEKAYVQGDTTDSRKVIGMDFSYDKSLVDEAIKETYRMDGIQYVRVWLNNGRLSVGDDIMQILIGGDIRSHVVDGLQYLINRIKQKCVNEIEIFE